MKSSEEFATEVALNYETATLALAAELRGGDIEAHKESYRRWRDAVAIMYALPFDDRLQGEALLARRGHIRDLDWELIQAMVEAFVAEEIASSALTSPAKSEEEVAKAIPPDQPNAGNDE